MVTILNNTANAIILGPTKTSIGGISSIIAMIKNELSNNEITYIDTSKSKNIVNNILRPFVIVLKLIRHIILLKKPSVIMFSSAYMSFWEKCIWALISSIKSRNVTIIMVDGNFPEYYSRLPTVLKKIVRKILEGVCIGVQSNEWKKYYSSIFPGSEIKEIKGCIDVDYFTPNKNNNKYVSLLYVGWVMPKKGIDDILLALNKLNGCGLNYKMNIVGPLFNNEEMYKSSISKYNLSDSVNLLGPIYSSDKLLREYQSADVFIFPSHYEGFPVALLEAISCGLASVGTKVGGIPDILNNGNNGILIDKEDVDALADAIKKLVLDKDLRKKYAEKARKFAVDNYNIKKSIESYKSLMSY